VLAIFAATAMAVRLLQSAAVRGLALTGAIRGVTPLASTCAVQPSTQISAIHCSAVGAAAQVEVAHAGKAALLRRRLSADEFPALCPIKLTVTVLPSR
jgi:hypothetical protein